MIQMVEAFYFGYLKKVAYQWSILDRPIKKTIFKKKKHGGAIYVISANLPHPTPTPKPITFQNHQIHNHFLSLNENFKIKQKT